MGEMVRMVGRQGLFMVMRVDWEQLVVDLLRRAEPHELDEGVPFSSIRTLDKDVSRAVQNFLSFSPPAEDEGEEPVTK